MMARAVTILLVMLWSAPAWAVVKYADNGASGCGTSSTTYNPTTRSCGSGSASMWNTIRSAADNLGAGNTLQIRAGIYTESCVNALVEGGTVGTPTRIEPYSGEAIVWIKGTSDTRDCIISFSSTQPYVTVDGHNADGTGSMVLDGQNRNVTTDQAILVGNNVDNITIQNLELKNSAESCINNIGSNSVVRFNVIHDCGTSGSYLWHGIYYAETGTEISDNTFYNIAGYAVHCYSSAASCSSSQILRNRIYAVGTATDAQSGGILVDGASNVIRFNVIRCADGTSDFGIHIYTGATSTVVEQNSITNCGTAVNIASTTSGAVLRNNIFYGNVTNLLDAGTGTTTTTNLTSNPSWVDAANADLHLSAGSAAIDACTDIGLSFDGPAPDCGAIEFSVTKPWSGTLSVVAGQFYLAKGFAGAPIAMAPVSENHVLPLGAALTVAQQVRCANTSDCSAIAYRLYYSCAACASGGAEMPVPDSASSDGLEFWVTVEESGLLNGAAGANLIGTETHINGSTSLTSTATAPIDLSQNSSTVLRWIIRIQLDAPSNAQYCFRAKDSGGISLNAYDPAGGICVSVGSASANAGP